MRTHIFVLHIIILHNIFKISYTGHNQSKLVPFAENKFRFIKKKKIARHLTIFVGKIWRTRIFFLVWPQIIKNIWFNLIWQKNQHYGNKHNTENGIFQFHTGNKQRIKYLHLFLATSFLVIDLNKFPENS